MTPHAAVDKAETKKPKAAPKSGKKLAIGDNVSSVDIELTNEEEQPCKLAELTKNKGAVVFMYPRANTGGCTKQACGFKDNYSGFEKAGFAVFGLSFDKAKSQKNWKIKYDLPYHLLTDPDGTVSLNPILTYISMLVPLVAELE